MELLLHQWGDWPELYRNTDKTEATEIVIIDSQMNYRGKLDTYDIISLFLGLLEFVYTVLYEPAGWLISVIPFGSDFVAWKDGFISGYASTYILPIIFDVVMTLVVSVVAGPELGGGFSVISNFIGIIHFFDHVWEGIAFLFWGLLKLPVFLVLLAGSVVVPPLVTIGMVLAAIELVSRISKLPSANVLDKQKKDK